MNTPRSLHTKKSLVCILSFLFCSLLAGNAHALLYDGFGNGVIDNSLWTITDPSSLLSERDGRLYFDAETSPTSARLVGAPAFDNIRMGLEFYDFSSTNSSPAGLGQSSALQLTLGPQANRVTVMTGSNALGNFFQFVYMDGTQTVSWVIPTTITTGKLGLYYDGTSVYGAYSNALGQDAPWYGIGEVVTPGWTAPVRFSISGYTGGTGATSFQIDNVGYSSVPVPPSMFLMIPGLAGIAFLRRRLKK